MGAMNWTSISQEHLNKEILEDGSPLTTVDVVNAIAKMEWVKPGPGLRVPGMAGEAIKAILADLGYKLGAVKRLSWKSHELAPFGLYGITYAYKNCDATSYWLDLGDKTIGLCSEKHEVRF